MVVKPTPRWSEVLNQIIENIKHDLNTSDKVEVTFRNIVRNYNVSFCTAYIIMVRLEKALYDMFGNNIEIFRRKGKLIIVKKKQEQKQSESFEEENRYGI